MTLSVIQRCEFLSAVYVYVMQWHGGYEFERKGLLHVCKVLLQGCTDLPKMFEPPQNSRCREGDVKAVLMQRTHKFQMPPYKKFDRLGDLASGIFALLYCPFMCRETQKWELLW